MYLGAALAYTFMYPGTYIHNVYTFWLLLHRVLPVTTLQDFLEPWLNCTLHCTAQFYMASLTDLLVCGPKTARVLCYNFKGTSYSI